MSVMTKFEEFFDKTWPKLLNDVPDRKDLFSNGGSLKDASWDRKAAFLVFDHLNPAPDFSAFSPEEEDDPFSIL